MSGGESLGNLYFDLGLDDKTFEAVFNATMKKYDNKFNIKVGVDATGIASTQKQINDLISVSSKPMTQFAAGKLGILAGESAEKQKLSQQKINTELEKTALAHKRNETFGTQSQSRIRSNAEFTNKTLLSQRQLALQLSNQFGTMFSIYAVERFVKKLAEVRGEFELQKVSLRAILQDAPAADAIFEQIKQLSVKSPFTFKDLIGYTKQLAAFSIPVNELYDTMKNLADVSAGLGVDMGRITLAFGQVRAASVLRGQELRQFTEAGIPLVEELAKKFTKLTGVVTSNGDVFEKISKRMVSFEMVKEIFDDMTSAGGKFYNMQELQASTLKGKMSNLTDSIDIALNSIGESNDGILKGAIDLTTELIRNWETVGKAISSIIAAYGTYKAAILVMNVAKAAQLGLTSAEIVRNMSLVSSMLTATAATNTKTVADIHAATAQRALNLAILANPYVIAASALIGLVGIMWSFQDATSASEQTQSRLNSIMDDNKTKSDEAKSTAESLLTTITSETSTVVKKIEALNRLKEIYPDFIKNMDYHALAAMNAEDRQKALNEAVDNFNIGSLDSKMREAKQSIEDAIVAAKPFNQGILQAGSDAILNATGLNLIIDTNQKKAEKEVEVRQELLNKLKQQKQIQLDIQAQADFDILPQEEKVKIWGKQRDQLLAIKANMIAVTKEADAFPNSLKRPVEIFDLLSKKNIFETSFTGLGALNKSLGILNDQISGKTPKLTTDKEDWEKKLKDAKDAWEKISRTDILGKSPESVETKRVIKEAESALKAWDLTNKSQKKSEDAAAKALEIKINLLKESYEIYKKLAEIKGKDAAKEMIANDPAFARYKNLPGGAKVPTTTAELSNAITPIIAASNQNSAGVKKLYRENAKLGMEGYIEGVKESSAKIFKTLDDAITAYKPKYDLYEKLLGLTGDKKKSSQLAFGKDAVDDYETFLRNQYAKMPGSSFFSELTPPEEGATEEVKKAWKDLVEYIQSKKLGKIEYFEQMISEAASASDKIKKIELDRERDIADAEKAYATDPERKKIAVDAAKNKADGQINEIRSTLFQLTPLYDEVFKDLGKVAIGNLDDLLGKTKGLVNILRDENKTEVKKDASGRITGYFVKKDTVDPDTGLKIEKDTLVSVEKYNELLERTNTIVNKINENPFKALFNPAKGDAAETTEERLARIGKGIAGLSELAQSVSGDLGGIMDSFGASAESQAALKNITDVATGTASIASGILSGDPVQAIKGIVGGIGKIIGGLTAIHDAKYEKQIKAYQKQIDATAKSYDKLTDSLSRKTAASKVDAQAEEYNLLQREKSLLETQKRAEEAKKKTDQSKIDDYDKQIEEASKKQRELALNTIDYVLGGNIGAQSDSWAKTLTDAMDTAFQNGTSAAEAWGKSVHDIVGQIAKQFIVTGYLGKEIQKILEAESSNWTNPNGTVNDAAIDSSFERIEKKTNALEPVAETLYKKYTDRFGTGKTSASSTGLTGEIKGVTEDTAQRLASLLNAIRQDSGVNRLVFAEMKNMLSEFSRGNIEANSYLNKINENTRLTAENTAAIVRAFNDVTGVGSQGKALRVL